MSTEIYDAMLADWIICELPDDQRFLAGRIVDDHKGRFCDGTHITTALVVSPVEAIADGHVVETQDSRYRLVDRYRADDAVFAKLDAWIGAQPAPPTLGDVLATNDGELFAAYILRGFRQATAEAVWAHSNDR